MNMYLMQEGIDGCLDAVDADDFDLFADLFGDPFEVALWDDAAGEPHAERLFDARLDSGDAADLSGEADLADGDGLWGELPVGEGGGDGRDDAEVDGGLRDAHAAGDGDEEVAGVEAEAEPFFHDGDEEGEPVAVDPHAAARGGGEGGVGDEGLDLDEDGARPFDHRDDGRANSPFLSLFEEEFGGVGDLLKAVAAHPEDGDLIGRPEPVFDDADHAKVVLLVPFEVEDGVDEVLEKPWAGDLARLGHMADEEGGEVSPFGDAHEFSGALAHLADRSWSGGDLAFEDDLDRVDDEEGGLEGVDLTFDEGEVGLAEEVDLGVGDGEAFCARVGLFDRLFTADVEDLSPFLSAGAGHLKEEGRLADAWISADQAERALDETAADEPVELGDLGGLAGLFRELDLAEADGLS